MHIGIANDHAGFAPKAQLIEYMQSLGHEVEDFGTYSEDRVDYPDFAAKLGRAVAAGKCDFGVLICGTGIGMSIAANKIKGVRAANVLVPEVAPLARQHNDANVLTISARYVDIETNKQIIKNYFNNNV